ncbi:uncharacterized protein LOC106163097 [Lingula anatina]|uniref:Uncharacterized protein LOC106163097 n=1 Tax=Lingula anatina TaxID=7574 RepID=A0A2R2MM20_LINAN|nr:uncharacterized protein LOC106163097 [Lingula anatina]|eukprot:XP_023931102.1 uncharacterized protein LOC106163097 [Lingula anatina]
MTGYSKTGVGIWGGICMIIAGTFARKRYKTTRSKRIYQGLAGLSFICALLLTGFGGKDTYSDSRRIAAINAANRNATTTIAPPTTTIKNVLLHNVNATAAPIQNASTINGPAVDTSDWPFHYHYPDMAYVRVLIDVLTMAVGVIYIMIFAKSAKETVLAPIGPWPTQGKETQMSDLSPTHKVHMELPPAYTAAGESE